MQMDPSSLAAAQLANGRAHKNSFERVPRRQDMTPATLTPHQLDVCSSSSCLLGVGCCSVAFKCTLAVGRYA